MDIKALTAVLAAAVILAAGCAADTAPGGNRTSADTADMYSIQGMEISKVAHAMGTDLYESYLRENVSEIGRKIDTVVLPEVAITSFVDTDTYEKAGHLGRVLAEVFVHELSSRGIPVYEYKLTGTMMVSEDGEYIYSRDYRRILQEASVAHILSGTISRNEDGVVLVARIVDLESHLVQASATGFIPYKLLPYCYRTGQKQCSLNGIEDYVMSLDGSKDGLSFSVTGSADTLSAGTEPQAAKAAAGGSALMVDSYEPIIAQSMGAGVVRPVTSRGNRAAFEDQVDWDDPMIYEAGSFLDKERLSRDVGDQSQYLRNKGWLSWF